MNRGGKPWPGHTPLSSAVLPCIITPGQPHCKCLVNCTFVCARSLGEFRSGSLCHYGPRPGDVLYWKVDRQQEVPLGGCGGPEAEVPLESTGSRYNRCQPILRQQRHRPPSQARTAGAAECSSHCRCRFGGARALRRASPGAGRVARRCRRGALGGARRARCAGGAPGRVEGGGRALYRRCNCACRLAPSAAGAQPCPAPPSSCVS